MAGKAFKRIGKKSTPESKEKIRKDIDKILNDSKEMVITKDQLEIIGHNKRMIESIADNIKGLCNSEKSDIVYGFELGQNYNWLRDCFISMMELESDIKLKKDR